MPDNKRLTRRTALGLITGGAFLSATGSFSFSFLNVERDVTVGIASPENALVGLTNLGPVQKNSREPMVDVTNNTSGQLTVIVSLDNPSDGTLYDPQGNSGSSVTFTLTPGGSGTVDIEANVTGTIPFTMSTSGDVAVDTSDSVESEAGNVKGAVVVKKLAGLTAHPNQDNWTIDDVTVKDGDGDNDLDRVEFEIKDGNANTVATRTDSCGCNGGSQYAPKGNPDVAIEPDDSSYDVTDSFYSVTVYGYDADGNLDSDTTDTTEK